MFLVLFTFMRKDDSGHGVMIWSVALQADSVVSDAAWVPSVLAAQGQRPRHSTLGRWHSQNYTAITLPRLPPIPLTLRVWLWQRLLGHQMHHCYFTKRKF